MVTPLIARCGLRHDDADDGDARLLGDARGYATLMMSLLAARRAPKMRARLIDAR